jgi:mono/diheme cytochrome c family protein
MNGIRTPLVAIASLALAGGAVAFAQDKPPPSAGPPPMPKPITLVDRPNATGGEKLYVEHCVMCHGPNGMGYGLLGRRLQQPDLEKRDNLVAQYVITAARRGIGSMPPVPRGEVSDGDLKQIADYLAAGPHGGGR